MPGVTPNLALPTALATDKVIDGDNAITNLATAVDTYLFGSTPAVTLAANVTGPAALAIRGAFVHLSFDITKSTASAYGAVLMTLPVGSRPAANLYLSAVDPATGLATGVMVQSGGSVVCAVAAGRGAPASTAGSIVFRRSGA